jgi:hypothetical protein
MIVGLMMMGMIGRMRGGDLLLFRLFYGVWLGGKEEKE